MPHWLKKWAKSEGSSRKNILVLDSSSRPQKEEEEII